jgi:hypothetical protein
VLLARNLGRRVPAVTSALAVSSVTVENPAFARVHAPSDYLSGLLRPARLLSSIMSASQLFRQCTASLSARSLARPALHTPRRLATGARWYSEGTAEPEKEAKKEEEGSSSSSTDSELAAKLKVKEDEVVDLKVSTMHYYVRNCWSLSVAYSSVKFFYYIQKCHDFTQSACWLVRIDLAGFPLLDSAR